MSNVYMDALLWLMAHSDSLTPTNPFPIDPITRETLISYTFGTGGTYNVYDPESTVYKVAATSWTRAEQLAVTSAFKAWSDIANISFTQRTDFTPTDLGDATFHLLVTNEAGMSTYFSGENGIQAFSTLPFNYGPNYGIFGIVYEKYTPGWSVFNQDGYAWTSFGIRPGGDGYVTILHEIGHLVGLDHPWNEKGWYTDASGKPLYDVNGNLITEPYFPGANNASTTGDYGLNQGIFTVESYNDGWKGQPAKTADYGYEKTPMAFDIAAAQSLYGANISYHTGNDVYTLPNANKSDTGWTCIWDAGGNDTIQAPSGAGACTIDLRAAPLTGPNAGGYVSWVSGIQGGFTIANNVIIENAIGGNANDTINGNGENDMISGGLGADTLTGGSGKITFVYNVISDSTPSSHDTITDFTHGQDKIDFTNIAGINASGGVPAFQGQLTGKGNLTLNAHSVAYIEVHGNTEVLANTMNTAEIVTSSKVGAANMEIVLMGIHLGLTSADFHHV